MSCRRIFTGVVLSAGLLLSPAWAAVPAEALARASGQELPSLAPMLEKVTPAVVNISTRGRVRVEDNPLMLDPFFRRFFSLPSRPRERETQSLGSGVVVDARRGYILTNNHVIDKAAEITVTLRDNRSLQAKLIGADPDTDVAVIQVQADKLSAVPLADSEALRVGDFVVAIGNPFGLGQTVTSGIVSAIGRSGLGIEGYEDFIQTDASINPGNSGGALVNLRGELVGINTAILSPGGGGNVGIGFAIPINLANDIMEQLIRHGEVRRGRLGVYMQDLTAELARAFGMSQGEGAVISQLVPGSAAEKAGLKPGDVVIAVNGRRVANSADLRNRIGLLRAGQKVRLKIIRNGEHKELTATVEAVERQRIAGGQISPYFAGAVFSLEDEDGSLARRGEGVQVLSVEESSPAWRAGLREGDVILSVNRQPLGDFEQFKAVVSKSRRGLLLNIQRGAGALFLLLQ